MGYTRLSKNAYQMLTRLNGYTNSSVNSTQLYFQVLCP